MNSPMSEQATLELAVAAWRAGLEALRPKNVLASLDFGAEQNVTLGDVVLFERSSALKVFALGKTARGLALAAQDQLGGLIVDGLVIDGEGVALGEPWRCLSGGHPRADDRSLRCGQAVLDWVLGLDPDDHLLVLMSGGASAMMELPANGWTLEATARARLADLEAGMTIESVNHRAAKRSLLKDGGLAKVSPCAWQQLTINDVVDGPDGLVSSGPFLGLNGQGHRLANHTSAARAAADFLRAKN